ncbi:hypothetical protein FOCC_FOCC008244 [Frankliniella occidentalis]|nr:hypothetical protein FOCC_FOCC008244 [Frankliniella occidentalis]
MDCELLKRPVTFHDAFTKRELLQLFLMFLFVLTSLVLMNTIIMYVVFGEWMLPRLFSSFVSGGCIFLLGPCFRCCLYKSGI